jgi:hypothetical protein
MDLKLIAGVSMGLLGSYLVSSKNVKTRRLAFVVYLVSNLIWSVYWIMDGEYVPLVQYALFSVMNVRGLMNNKE